MNDSPGSVTMGAFLTLAVTVAITITSVGYFTGSTPEWVMVKGSIGMLIVGMIGWLVAAVVSRPSKREPSEPSDGKGAKVDVTVSETASGDQTA